MRFLSLIYRGYNQSSSIRYSVSAFSSSAVPGKKQNENENTKKNIPPHNITASGSSTGNTLLDPEQLDASTRAMGQVIFLNSTTSGRIIFASLVLGDPTLAAFAALGSFTATSTSKFIGLDEDTYKNGLWGYNGALIGCAASVFGPAYPPYMVLSTMLGSAATPVLSASVKNATSLPQWTWPFNVVALTSLLQTRSLLESSKSATTDTGLEETVASSVSTIPTTEIIDVVSSPLLGISQIFVVGSPLTGAGISAAIYMYSPKLAYHALGGSAIGCAVGVLSGADISDVCMGLWGYNSALSSMAIGTFFVHSRESMILSASSAVASAALFGGMQSLFGTYGLPCLTLPFCSIASAITSVCYLSEGQILGLKLARAPHSPEKNS